MLWVQRTVCGPLFRSLELGGQRAVGRVSLGRHQEWERTRDGRISIESVGVTMCVQEEALNLLERTPNSESN